MVRVDLPYPHKLLWPNGRTRSHDAKAAQVRKHREWADLATLADIGRRLIAFDPFRPIPVRITVTRKAAGVYPDRDNSVAAAKAYLDGIADRLRLNDALFAAPLVEFLKPCSGRFIIEIGEP